MSENISQYIATIRSAVYGKDMRNAIASAFETLSKGASVEYPIDDSLTLSNYGADAKVVGDKFKEVNDQINAIVPGLSIAEKDAILNYFAEQVEIHPDLESYYDVISNIWRPKVVGVSLDRTSLTMGVGMSVTLVPIFYPEDAYDKTGTWSVSPSGIVTCVNGIVFASSIGNATVTFTTNDGAKTASCSIEVTSQEFYTITKNLQNITLSNEDSGILSGDSYSTTLIPDSGYGISNVQVTMGGSNVTSTYYNSDTKKILIPSVTGDIVITATAVDGIYYNVSYELSGCSVETIINSVKQNNSLSVLVTVNDDTYEFISYTIKMSGIDITSDVTDLTDDGLEISIPKVIGNVSIDILAEAPPSFANDTWERISELSSSGQAANFYNVGDRKTITVNGTWTIKEFNNLSVDVYIIGINHNAAIEGNNLIHIKFGFLNDKQIGWRDGNAAGGGSTPGFRISLSDVCRKWADSYMCNICLGNGSGTPNSPGSNSFMSILPEDLRSVMKIAHKYGGSWSVGALDVLNMEINDEYVSIPSLYEFMGANYDGITADVDQYFVYSDIESQYQDQYDYYRFGNSLTHYSDRTSNDTQFWTKTPKTTDPDVWEGHTRFIGISSLQGGLYPGHMIVSGTIGVTPIFFV